MNIIGRNPITELLRSDFTVKELLIQTGINEDNKISEILNLASQQRILITETPKKKLDKIADHEPHQGVVAITDFKVRTFSETDLENNPGSYIYIREAQYEHNLGAIIRTAEVAGLKGVIIPPKQDITPTVFRISMGAAFHIPIYKGSLFPTIKLFKSFGMLTTAIERNNHTSIYEGNLKDNQLLIIGGEDKSISSPVIDKVDQVLDIPQKGKINSLNMSVAAAITIFEHIRQRSQS